MPLTTPCSKFSQPLSNEIIQGAVIYRPSIYCKTEGVLNDTQRHHYVLLEMQGKHLSPFKVEDTLSYKIEGTPDSNDLS